MEMVASDVQLYIQFNGWGRPVPACGEWAYTSSLAVDRHVLALPLQSLRLLSVIFNPFDTGFQEPVFCLCVHVWIGQGSQSVFEPCQLVLIIYRIWHRFTGLFQSGLRLFFFLLQFIRLFFPAKGKARVRRKRIPMIAGARA